MKNKIIIVILLLCANSAFAFKVAAVPGGVVKIPLNIKSEATPMVNFEGHRVLVQQQANGNWQAIVGIPLKTKAGTHFITVNDKKVSFDIKSKQYEKQFLTITNKRKVNPNPDDLKRIAIETKEINKYLSHWSKPASKKSFAAPALGRISSSFGLQRFFNQQPKSPHSGLDIAAPFGSNILAANAGTVLGAGNFFYCGNAVFIDHGMSLISIYCHMNSIKVKTGQQVKQGEVIGTVGKTGRVTGPHLHWGMSLNQARVDPSLFVGLNVITG